MNADLQSYLDRTIPQSAAMQVRVDAADARGVVLRAPLAPNVNHEGTAFGGSIGALATLACWGWLWAHLRSGGTQPRIVVARSEVDYLAPATSDFLARCRAPASVVSDAFDRAYARRGRARIALEATVEDADGKVCARFKGWFVAIGMGRSA